MASVLIVQPDRVTAKLIANRLNGGPSGYETHPVCDLAGVRRVIRSHRVDLAILHVGPDLRATVDLLTDGKATPRIVVTGVHPGPFHRESLPDRVDAVVSTNAAPEQLPRTVAEHLPC